MAKAKKPAAKQDEPKTEADASTVEDVQTPEQGKDNDLQAKRDALNVGHVNAAPVHFRTEVAQAFSGLDGGELTISTADGRVTFRADKNVKFDRDGTANVKQFLERAFQAVA